MILQLTLIFVLFSLVEGVRDGFMYHYRSMSSDNRYNIHWLFTIERSIVVFSLSLILLLYRHDTSIVYATTFGCSISLIFSFLHNGSYYTTRHFLNKEIYPLTFFDDSTTSTATFELSVAHRIVLAIIGFIGIVTLSML